MKSAGRIAIILSIALALLIGFSRSTTMAGLQMIRTLGFIELLPLLLIVACVGLLFVRILQQNRSLSRSRSLLQATIDSSADGVLVIDTAGQIVLTNGLFWSMWNISQETQSQPAAFKQAMLDQMANPVEFLSTEHSVRDDNGSVLHDLIELRDGRTLERVSNPQKIDGHIVGRIWSFHDITAEIHSEQQLMRAAMYDPLTGLPNRTHLVQRLCQMAGDARYAIALVNIDRFKNVNDTLGHLAGDQMISGTADRLRQVADELKTEGEADPIVARVGPDEFALLLIADRSTEVAIDTARYIQQAFARSFEIAGQQLFASVSIGLAVADTTHADPMQILRDADTALYRAKAGGKGKFILFDRAMRQSVANYFQIENELRTAIEQQQLEVWYQPLVCLGTGRLTGFEALVRWRHPEKGIINPGDFIPVAEDTGLVIPIGVFVLDQAARQVVQWNHGIRAADPVHVSVNLSRRHLASDDILHLVRRAIRDLGADPSWLKLEITESMVMGDMHQSVLLLNELRKMHVPIHLDDFGTGHSSLATLKALPVDGIKIDRAFVATIRNGHRPDILNAIMTLGRGLGMEIVAEGIETPEQLAVLVSLQCDIGQGFLFGRPVTAGATETLLLAEQRAIQQGRCYWNVIESDPALCAKVG